MKIIFLLYIYIYIYKYFEISNIMLEKMSLSTIN